MIIKLADRYDNLMDRCSDNDYSMRKTVIESTKLLLTFAKKWDLTDFFVYDKIKEIVN